MSLTTLKSLDAEIRQLEARKKLVEKRDGDVPKAIAVLQRYAGVLTVAQRRKIAGIAGEPVADINRSDAGPEQVRGVKRGLRRGVKLGAVAPKYRIPSGAEWTGRGRMPTAFVEWLGTGEGKEWQKANPGEKAPLITARKPRKASAQSSRGGAVARSSRTGGSSKAVTSAKKAVKKSTASSGRKRKKSKAS